MENKSSMSGKHTFVVCAYGKSPYLEDCVKSLVMQEEKSEVLIATSTMNESISEIAQKYGIKVHARDGKSGIAQDWNYALSVAETPYVTIAHQDDVYDADFSKRCIEKLDVAKDPLIFFSDYDELRGEVRVHKNRLLNVKRIMLLPLRIKWLHNSRFVRRRILSFGSPICCPSVTYVRANLPSEIFQIKYRGAVDWQAWEMLSKLKGAFVYDVKPLMCHRIHEESETSRIIADKNREHEDYEMLCKFWGNHIGSIIFYFYRKGQNSNKLE